MQTCVIFDNMLQLPTSGNRRLYYLHLEPENLIDLKIENENWMCLIKCEKFSVKKHKVHIEKIIALKPLFIYCVASNHPDLEECVISELCNANEGYHDDTELPLTFGDNDLKGAIKFCLESAFHESKNIDEVVIIDLNDEGLSETEIRSFI